MKISDYAFISDCQSAALVSGGGSVDWLCLPRFDSDAVFARLLDPDGGHWRLGPAAEFASSRAYGDEALVLRTFFTTPVGAVEVTDALALEPGSRGHGIGRRVPHVLLRHARGVRGRVEMEMDLCPRPAYGAERPLIERSEGGLVIKGSGIALKLAAPADVELEIGEGAATARFSLAAGDEAGFSLALIGADRRGAQAGARTGAWPVRQAANQTANRAGNSPLGSGSRAQTAAGGARVTAPDATTRSVAAAISGTAESWQSLSALHHTYRGLYSDEVRRSALVLQGLTFQPSGAVVAAATTSLPEVLGGGANWDYRYAWLRDSSMMIRALWVAACPDEPESFYGWVHRVSGREGRAAVQIMYGVEGERDLSERRLDHLAGFAGSRPVRVGNDAWRQKQLDVLGEVLDSAYVLRDYLADPTEPVRELLAAFADRAAAGWREPDAGIWEARDRERHYTFSKLMCWVALDRALKLEDVLAPEEGQRQAWFAARAEVRRAILEQAWNPETGAFAGALGSDRLDAAVLLMPLVGFLPATDGRMRATIEAVEDRLCDGGLVRRWREEENGFFICSYWMVECLALLGETGRAREHFDRVTALANDLGLMSEMADPRTGVLLGNFPQAFSHVGLINAAWRLTEAERSGRGSV